MSQCPEELVGAEVSHSMALILSSDPRHNGEFIPRQKFASTYAWGV